MSKHTPGPWTFDPQTQYVCSEDGTPIVDCAPDSNWVTDSKTRDANGRLIAAAPETAAERDRLREIKDACRNARVILEDIAACADQSERQQLEPIINQLSDAIAKAEGR